MLTFFQTNIFILFLTTSMPRSFDAFISKTASLKHCTPKSCLAKQSIDVVFPVPGGPQIIKFGRLPSSANTFSRLIVSSLPTMSFNKIGLYFSTHGKLGLASLTLHFLFTNSAVGSKSISSLLILKM
ncbi:hypothetical protein BpHYR1_041653 [Brachionus plicatilis]|uniref:Uncharacterized protein n=1 Tax=Brachionus plicatilis TaxID=10195 RepID=A0A3M7ST96_BRAPC|nr:hypothetical protein BpHYR1_041653 [Brachionus plicatilis]